jgi:enoyl-CoA hydratase
MNNPMTEHLDMIEATRSGAVGIVTLKRPEARNALSRALIGALASELDALQSDAGVKVIVLTGDPVFCAGADVAEMKSISLIEALAEDFSGCCERLAQCSKPLIAAVEGYAIGGGCEMIEMCDIVVAGENARFGHPEITLGTLSGAGGTQRLARAVGRAKAMDLILTGRLINASDAERIGLISRVVAAGAALAAAMEIAELLAGHAPQAVRFAKEAVDRAVSLGLEDGLRLERRLFHLSFATGEFQAGMERFLARRPGPSR